MTALRWVARILGVLIVGLFVVFAIGQGFEPLKRTGVEFALMSALLIALSGMIVGWRRELLGGVMVVAGMTAFYSINFAVSGQLPGGWVFPLCFVPGILSIACWVGGRTPTPGRLTGR